MNLLIVNDSEPTRRFLDEKVDWPTYGITQRYLAECAGAARRLMLKHEIDIVLCDIQMPGENGLEFIRWVCDNGFDCECVFLTCYALFEYAQEAIQLGCSDFILFTCSTAKIGNAVQKVVSRRLQQQESDRLKQFGQYWLSERQSNRPGAFPKDVTPREVVDNAIQYILDHLSSPQLNVAMLAKQCCLSIDYFSRLFKKHAGMSASQFIIRERMLRAASLLTSTNASISAISLEVGYDNLPYFTSAFKKFFGITPSHYREASANK